MRVPCHYLHTNLFRLFTFCCSFIRIHSFSLSVTIYTSCVFVIFTNITHYCAANAKGEKEIERINLVIILNMVFLRLLSNVLFDLFLFLLSFDSRIVRCLDVRLFFGFGKYITVAHEIR